VVEPIVSQNLEKERQGCDEVLSLIGAWLANRTNAVSQNIRGQSYHVGRESQLHKKSTFCTTSGEERAWTDPLYDDIRGWETGPKSWRKQDSTARQVTGGSQYDCTRRNPDDSLATPNSSGARRYGVEKARWSSSLSKKSGESSKVTKAIRAIP